MEELKLKRKTQGVYLIYDNENLDHYYIGSSVDISGRINHHRSYLKRGIHGNRKMQNFFNKNGMDKFNWCVLLFYKGTSQKELRNYEQDFIDQFKATEKGLNICSTTECISHTPEGLKSMSEKARVRQSSPEYKEQLSIKYSGTKSVTAKLTSQDISYIKKNAKKGIIGGGRYKELSNIPKLANKFNVSTTTILRVLNNKTYKRDQ